jgi:Phage Terminase
MNQLTQPQEAPALEPTPWDDDKVPYTNSVTKKAYKPHTDEELDALRDDSTPHVIALGGEGSGKTTWLVVKVLERLRRGCNGIMGSPDMPHFSKSLWTEFQAWCPWDKVVPAQRYRSRPEWTPTQYFTLNFINGAELQCGGFKEPMSWEGGNMNFAAYDEVRRSDNPAMAKVLAGRVRIVGPGGELPQIMYSSTPRGGSPGDHWMYDYFGPDRPADPMADFKQHLKRVHLRTFDNVPNLSPEYIQTRSLGLSDIEQGVYLGGDWGTVEDGIPFLPDPSWWSNCQVADFPLLTRRDPLVLALDAGTDDDSFAALALGINPVPDNPAHYAVRWTKEWIPPKGGLDTTMVFNEVHGFVTSWNVVKVVYDKYQLYHFMRQLSAEVDAFVEQFDQTTKRLLADKALLDSIRTRDIVHLGDEALNRHMKNADKKTDAQDRIRIVKRTNAMKVDLVVALSMANYEAGLVL